MVVVTRFLLLCAVLLALPTITAAQSTPNTYFDDFSIYTPGLPPTGWLLRGTDQITPTIQEVGGTGPSYRLVDFPEVPWQYWDRWLLKDGLTPHAPYTVTVKLNFQNEVADRAGLTIAWNDTNSNRIDIQPNVYWNEIEFRETYNGPIQSNVVVNNAGYIPISAFTEYWLRVAVVDDSPGQGQLLVLWSTDGTNFSEVINAEGLHDLAGLIGISTAGPHLPRVYFDDFLVVQEAELGSIRIHAFHDANQNSEQDAEEFNLDGWVMTLYQEGGCTGNMLNSGTTDADGNLSFDGLPTGTYSVEETLQNNWVNISPICQSVIVRAGQLQPMLFGNWPKGGKPPKLGGSQLGILLPFSIGQTWKICQGYNGQVSHTGTVKYALDLSIDPNSAGPVGCGLGPSASDDEIVTAPGTGKVVSFWSYDATNDLVCIDLDEGGSVQIGHMVPVNADGVLLTKNDIVIEGEQIGTVLPLSQSSQSGYAHIHIEAFSKSKCKGSSAVPFTSAFQFQCVPPLPFKEDTDTNQYRATSLTRCY